MNHLSCQPISWKRRAPRLRRRRLQKLLKVSQIEIYVRLGNWAVELKNMNRLLYALSQ